MLLRPHVVAPDVLENGCIVVSDYLASRTFPWRVAHYFWVQMQQLLEPVLLILHEEGKKYESNFRIHATNKCVCQAIFDVVV